MTVAEDKEMIGRVIREPDAAKLLPRACNDREYYDPTMETLYGFEYSFETRQLADVPSLYRASSPVTPPPPSINE